MFPLLIWDSLRWFGVSLEEEKSKQNTVTLPFALLSQFILILLMYSVNLTLHTHIRKTPYIHFKYSYLILFNHTFAFGITLNNGDWCHVFMQIFFFFSSKLVSVPVLSCHWFVNLLCSPLLCYLLIALFFHALLFLSCTVKSYHALWSLRLNPCLPTKFSFVVLPDFDSQLFLLGLNVDYSCLIRLHVFWTLLWRILDTISGFDWIKKASLSAWVLRHVTCSFITSANFIGGHCFHIFLFACLLPM